MRRAFLVTAAVLAAVAGAARAAAAQPDLLAPWAQLGDTALARLEGEALANNRDVRAAQARLGRARADRRLAAYDLAPTATAGASYTRRRLSASQFPGVPADLRAQTLFDVGVDAAYELDVFGRVRRTVAAGRAFEGSAAEAVRAARVALAAEVARTYYELRGVQREMRVAERNAANQRRTQQLTLDRLAAGRGTGLDRERASAQLSGTLATMPRLETRAAAAVYRLGVLIGRESAVVAGALPIAPAPSAGAPLVRSAAFRADADTASGDARDSVDDLAAGGAGRASLPDAATIAALVRRRPDVASAERQLAARSALVGAARADYLPRVTVVAGAGRNAGAVDALRAGDALRYSVGPVVSWPAFDLGRVRTRVDAAQADVAEARARYDQTLLTALDEAQAARAEVERTRARLALLAQAAGASGRGASLARLRFTGGAAGFLDVLDAERSVLDAERELAAGRTDAAVAAVGLYQALGGAWPGGGAVASGGR